MWRRITHAQTTCAIRKAYYAIRDTQCMLRDTRYALRVTQTCPQRGALIRVTCYAIRKRAHSVLSPGWRPGNRWQLAGDHWRPTGD
eukprot:498607-Prymnesium_polylepis.1